MRKTPSKFLLWPALAAAIAVGGIASQVQAEGSSSTAEVQRGVPGVDVDLNANRSQGLDVDMQAGAQNDSDNGITNTDPDTRTLGAGGDMDSGSTRTPIVDRN